MSNFLAAAKATSKPPLPHQQAAWNFAWDLLSIEEQQEFLSKFRSAPPYETAERLASPLGAPRVRYLLAQILAFEAAHNITPLEP